MVARPAVGIEDDVEELDAGHVSRIAGRPAERHEVVAAEPRDPRVGVREDVGEEVGVLRREHARGRRRGALVEHAAGGVAHPRDREGLREATARAERGVRVREIEEPDLAAAEREPETVALDLGQCPESEATGHLEHRLEPEVVERADRRDVQRGRERDAKRHDPVEGTVEVERRVRAVLRWEARGDVEERRRGGEPVLERGRVEERFERRARLAGREDHVDVAAMRGIAVRRARDEGEDPSGPRLDRDERGVGHVPVAEFA